MTAAITPTISRPDTAFILQANLGPLRCWVDFLSDNIRGRQSVAGYTLMPCARQHDGKAYRPVYAVSDVQAFIENVQKAIPSAGRRPIKTTSLSLNRGTDWRVNNFDRDGAPVARLSVTRSAKSPSPVAGM
ncbi:hypothetical protein PQQ53_06985 [Paraburkholderia strydomiana]|jgi:hypothetical protein|uniref:hypothetical protein n=1 Tax=Paraburkholderia strydomiana TaxID=1245417 RepID=UPI0038BAD799